MPTEPRGWGLWAAVAGLFTAGPVAADPPLPTPPGSYPTVPAAHVHARALLANALKYADPANKTFDPVSGYPYEGWNHDPKTGIFLQGFTQLTAIGVWMELLANVAAGTVEVPNVPRDEAIKRLAFVVKTLRRDQQDPALAAMGLMVNFLDLGPKRLSPLTPEVDREQFYEAFGQETGEVVWNALILKGWLTSQNGGREGAVNRGDKYGWNFFDGPLAQFKDDAAKKKVMAILDQRVVTATFGDNANLTASVGRTIGALLGPTVKDHPEAVAVRDELEKFLEAQRPGYTHLFDPKIGLFYFGWNATRGRMFGWEDQKGNWTYGHQDYLVNEFRGPTAFVVVRYGLPVSTLGNLGFKMKPYTLTDGKTVYSLAAWEGSAFQALGLSVWAGEVDTKSWRTLLEAAVDVQIDYTTKKKLPGFLSECYTGNGYQYTGDVGIPDVTVDPAPRITDAASLYTLGPAYTLAPDKVEKYLAAHWPGIAATFTDHGPWEGTNVTKNEVTKCQTTAHTLTLALGLLGVSPGQTDRYLESRGLATKLLALDQAGDAVDLMAADTPIYAWGQKGGDLQSTRAGEFRAGGQRVERIGMAFVPPKPVNLSGGVLTLRYRYAGPTGWATVTLKRAGPAPEEAGRISDDIFARLEDTGGKEAELRVQLPATPGLKEIKEFVIAYERGKVGPLELTVTHCGVVPTPLGDK
jgi:hypothetical protein